VQEVQEQKVALSRQQVMPNSFQLPHVL